MTNQMILFNYFNIEKSADFLIQKISSAWFNIFAEAFISLSFICPLKIRKVTENFDKIRKLECFQTT